MKFYLAPLLILSCSLIAVPDASEWNKPRNFHVAFEDQFTDQIKIIEIKNLAPSKAAEYSKNEAYWFELEPLNEKTNEQRISVSADGLATISLKDTYPNFPTQAHWINEKLIFIRVSWGRIVGTDLIFDTEKKEFIHREMVYDGTILYQQTRQALGRADPDGSGQ
ncbi:MAG: hypothetical protein CML13_13745 [Puniceicoccaceae bacterium]|nr:hypothetical protein [Puniceicoccaceae bacterium]|tara:strand:- start:1445 stop:1939 length:495 start_codon:yes stop_codon:yes gene_type:complete